MKFGKFAMEVNVLNAICPTQRKTNIAYNQLADRIMVVKAAARVSTPPVAIHACAGIPKRGNDHRVGMFRQGGHVSAMPKGFCQNIPAANLTTVRGRSSRQARNEFISTASQRLMGLLLLLSRDAQLVALSLVGAESDGHAAARDSVEEFAPGHGCLTLIRLVASRTQQPRQQVDDI